MSPLVLGRLAAVEPARDKGRDKLPGGVEALFDAIDSGGRVAHDEPRVLDQHTRIAHELAREDVIVGWITQRPPANRAVRGAHNRLWSVSPIPHAFSDSG